MRRFAPILLAVGSFMVSGCLGTVADVVTAPVKVVGKGVDLLTTSQSEADEKRGREIRKREERLGKLERAYAKQMKQCQKGDARKCDDAAGTYAEIQQVLPTIPVEPDD